MQASAHVPFPCAVYVQVQRGVAFVFSHWCETAAIKTFPHSLRVRDLRAHDPRQNESALRRATFVALVSGDVAQCVSVSNAHEKNRVRFLFAGSVYDRRKARRHTFSEIEDDYVPMLFHATMGVFDARHCFHTAIALESGVALFPRRVLEKDMPLLARWVEACMQKSIAASIWVTHDGKNYNEASRACSRNIIGRVFNTRNDAQDKRATRPVKRKARHGALGA